MKRAQLAAVLAVMLALCGCFSKQEGGQDLRGFEQGGEEAPQIVRQEFDYTEDGVIVPEQAKAVIEERSDRVIRLIRDKDFRTLAGFVHPEKGVRFTPYTYVMVDTDVVLNRDKIADFFEDDTEYLWGYFDGTGDEILMTPRQYYQRFIYTRDFASAPEVGYNEVLSYGNMLENQFKVYHNPIVVEYYFPGMNPDYGGLDWRSLRLVFEQFEGQWYLVGIINNEWTVEFKIERALAKWSPRPMEVFDKAIWNGKASRFFARFSLGTLQFFCYTIVSKQIRVFLTNRGNSQTVCFSEIKNGERFEQRRRDDYAS